MYISSIEGTTRHYKQHGWRKMQIKKENTRNEIHATHDLRFS